MSSDQTDRLAELSSELTAMRERLAVLEAKERSRRGRLLLVAATLLSASFGFAASGACPNGLPVCFQANTPALAGDVNINFATLKEWLEQKVGPTGSAAVTIQGATRVQANSTSNAAAAAGKALFVSGTASDGTTNSGGIAEFRHDNLTQGIGLGYNTIYATGTPNQDLNLKAAGVGTVKALGDFAVSANVWGSGPNAQASSNRVACSPTNYRCPNGQFVCGITFNHVCNVNWWEEVVNLECCTL